MLAELDKNLAFADIMLNYAGTVIYIGKTLRDTISSLNKTAPEPLPNFIADLDNKMYTILKNILDILIDETFYVCSFKNRRYVYHKSEINKTFVDTDIEEIFRFLGAKIICLNAELSERVHNEMQLSKFNVTVLDKKLNLVAEYLPITVFDTTLRNILCELYLLEFTDINKLIQEEHVQSYLITDHDRSDYLIIKMLLKSLTDQVFYVYETNGNVQMMVHESELYDYKTFNLTEYIESEKTCSNAKVRKLQPEIGKIIEHHIYERKSRELINKLH